MYLRRRGQRRGRGCTGGAVSGDRRSRLLVEPLEPRRLLTANDGGLVSEDAGNYDQSDIHEPQIVVAQGDMFAPVATVQSGSDIVSFYGYNTENTHSSNTGYEASGYVTFVVHEDDSGDVGLVILVDAPHDEGGGTVNFDIDGLDSATIVVEDESNEQTPSSGESLFSRSWNAQANDGAAYSNLGYYFSITVDPNYLFGIDGFQVVDGADDSTVQIPLADEEFEIYAEYGLEISAVPSVVLEAEGTLSATITRGGATDQDLLVSLQTSHTDRVSLPETVLIPAGASSANFAVELIDNSLPYDAFTMTVTASAERFRDSQVVLDVVDDDLPSLDVGIELTSYDANGLDFSSGYLVTGTTINHAVSVTNIQQIALSSPTVFFDGQTPNDSSDDVMFTPHRNGNDANVGDLNNNLLFDPGEVWQFSLEDVVGSGQNVGRVYCGAVYPTLDIALSDSVSAGYFGVSPALAINLDSANPGENLLVLAGESVTTHYALSNTGNTGLTDVVVDGATYISGDTNADTILDVGEVWSYAHTGEALAGAQSLSAAVTARDALTDTGVSGTASGSYFGAVVGVAVDQTLDSAYVLSGGSVAANYALSNTGNTGLTDVVVDGATYISGDTNADTILDVGEVWS
ncbi:MAG: hypothetical protein P8K78_03200, partial [Pirellulales bacterium]|nr:hypothetical protein [Pirellulales bacterium]